MNFTYRSSLCWDCEKATNSGCSWSKSFKPVKGWEAEPKPIKLTATKNIDSYLVIKCPQFAEDEHSRKERIKSGGAAYAG